MRERGAILSFEPISNPHTAIAGVNLITQAVSLGSVDTLIQHPASLSHHIANLCDRVAAGINDQLLRLSVGLEDVEDLCQDANWHSRRADPTGLLLDSRPWVGQAGPGCSRPDT
ncbi:PLP-dependent transferase [Nocardia sp. NPDC088792]|uniref:PLP-dependent transferase n=1 Tax=Nocardia sp. NPDC088792 TaxID=3364332 RepID=UPI00381656E4